jgi:hypothetical protein
VQDYRAGSSAVWELVYSRSWYEFSGQTILGLFQSLVGPGELALGLYLLVAAVVYVAVARLWWGGLASEPRRYLQLAALPVAAVILAPHALAYELTMWLATGWLLLRYADTRPSVQPFIRLFCVAGWAVSNIVTLTERTLGFPWATVVGLAALVTIVWLYRGREVEAESALIYPVPPTSASRAAAHQAARP